jgi:threonine/homoserine/homoserine lactone efflux protein
MNDLGYLLTGLILGLSSGISPGPLFMLVIKESLTHGKGAGIRVALSPLVTDTTVILVALFVFSKFQSTSPVLGIISLGGAIFLFYLGWDSWHTPPIHLDINSPGTASLGKGIITNFLSPHPYLFWITVGCPLILKAYHIHLPAAILFLTGFYVGLIGSKIGLAILVDHSRHFLEGAVYHWSLRILGLCLAGFGILLLFDGWKLLHS